MALFVSSMTGERQQEFEGLSAFYRARNQILHDAAIRPTVRLKDGRLFDLEAVLDCAFTHVAKALKRIIGDVTLTSKGKPQFVADLEKAVIPFVSELKTSEKLF